MSVEPGEALVEVAVPNDAELFDGSISEKPIPETVEESEKIVEEKPAEQPRDETGKFVKTEEPKVEATEKVDDNAAQVPSWRVREINAEKAEIAKALETEKAERAKVMSEFQAMQRQIAELSKPAEQPKQVKPDPLLDPEGYEKYIEQRLEDRFLSERRETSLRLAHRTYKDEFTEAYSAAQQSMAKGDVALSARMQKSGDPGETLIQWHREQKTMREVGNDPNAFFEKRLEAYLSDPANLGKVMERAKAAASSPTQTGVKRPVVDLPPSLSSGTRADNSRGSDDDDVSDEGLFKYATR